VGLHDKEKIMTDKFKVGIVGYGFAGKYFHSYLVNLEEGLELYAVSSRNEGRRKAAENDYGVVTYPTIDGLLSDEKVDLVVIATPHDTHAELAIKSMEAGKHVVVDKIMCLNVPEADLMIEVSGKNDVLLSIFHNRRWDGDYLTVRKILEEGLLGETFLFETAILGYHRPGGWRWVKSQSGGILFDWGAHLVDQALLLVPSEPKSVFCDAQYRKWETDIETHMKCLIRFENEVLYSIELSHVALAPKPRWYILGTEGALCKNGLDPQERAMIDGDIDAAEENLANRAKLWRKIGDHTEEKTIETVRGNWKAYYRNISQVLRGEAELAVKPQEVRKAMRVFDAAMKSAETGSSVRL